MRRSALVAVLLAGVLAALRASAALDLVAEARAIRARGCDGRAGGQPALRRDAALDRAARALAGGATFKEAMSGSGYIARQSAMLEVAGTTDAAIARALAERGCKDIADPVYSDIGVASGNGRAWLVLASPLSPPAPREAGAVSRRVLALVNEARASARRCGWKRHPAAPPLALSETLGRVALAHAEDMAQHSRLGHAGSDGSTPAERATRAGYRWKFVAENVAAGQPTPDEVVAEWLGSAGHCANIMDSDYAEMGVGFATNAQSDKKIYWSQVFGLPAR